ncbi:cob(I)yrinic acid a,c-diamide adenosyltransferase [Horticoccus luteus]|uniref:Corrinoid adenosyltransferase n=1 Tax=Horticoccus luteus TaxID=2862869 RepID=A0A8F9TV50_9BACT|nr:cob(I)yrinic acid a,c-diamide adenosyltransferase [Horticoccus luteus]QYM79829.1 cob(I)yrinic acid a,c-diamide adenosyltransferase [Horticoccus luteus]
MSIATRTGDDGTTSLLFGQRVPKGHPQIEAVGACDELNAALGVAKAADANPTRRQQLTLIQHDLIALMGEIACAEGDLARYEKSKFRRLQPEDLSRLDDAVAALEKQSLDLSGWATPGATPTSAALEVARTAARRAERRMSALAAAGRGLRPLLGRYMNRVSDLLWLLAREAESG